MSDLVGDAVDDLFVHRFHAGGKVLFNLETARLIAGAVVDHPEAEIGAVEERAESAQLRRLFAVTVRNRVRRLKRRGRVVTYDDLLTRLATSIADPVRGQMVAERLRRRYSMAVVDEFQDTDIVQWRILRAAFGSPPSRLVLVGDPKQAIYAFRGGDVHAYLEATEGAFKRGLDVSWRADQPSLDGLDAFLGGAQLGRPIVVHRPLRARPGTEQSRLVGPDVGAPLTVRIADRQCGGIERTPTGFAQAPSARGLIVADVAAEAVRILSAGTEIPQSCRRSSRLSHSSSVAVGGVGRIHRDQMWAAERETASEDLRLLYVAMTRARHRVVVWWASAFDAPKSPFARVLLGRDRRPVPCLTGSRASPTRQRCATPSVRWRQRVRRSPSRRSAPSAAPGFCPPR